jgi:hypothetical protein
VERRSNKLLDGTPLTIRDTQSMAFIQSYRLPFRRIPWRRMLLIAAYASTIALTSAILGTANLATKMLSPGAVESYQSPTYSRALPAPPTLDPTKKIAVVVSGPRGVEIGDAMEAYEVLARSDLYNVYTVAPERKPLSMNPGPTFGGSGIDFIPHYSFADYDAQIGRAPDLIAIPYFDPAYNPVADAATLDWIRTSAPTPRFLGSALATSSWLTRDWLQDATRRRIPEPSIESRRHRRQQTGCTTSAMSTTATSLPRAI